MTTPRDIQAGRAYVEVTSPADLLRRDLRYNQMLVERFGDSVKRVQIPRFGEQLGRELGRSNSAVSRWAESTKRTIAGALAIGGIAAGGGALLLGRAMRSALDVTGVWKKPVTGRPADARGGQTFDIGQSTRSAQITAGIQSRRYLENALIARGISGASGLGALALRGGGALARTVGIMGKERDWFGVSGGVGHRLAVPQIGTALDAAGKVAMRIGQSLERVDRYFSALAGKYTKTRAGFQATFGQKTAELYQLGGKTGGIYNWFGNRRVTPELSKQADTEVQREMRRAQNLGLLSPGLVAGNAGLGSAALSAGSTPPPAPRRGITSRLFGGGRRGNAGRTASDSVPMTAGGGAEALPPVLDAAPTERAAGRISAALDNVRNRALVVSAALAGAAGAIAYPLLSAVSQFAHYGDMLNKSSLKTGLTVEEFAGLAHGAELADVSVENLQTGLKQMQKTIVDARMGKKEALEGYGMLGLSAEALSGKGASEQIGMIADALSKVGNPAIKTAAAMKIFGISGVNMIPMLEQGSAGLKAAAKDAEELGLVMSGDAAEASEEYNDNLTRLGKAVLGVKIAIGSVLLPKLNSLVQMLVTGVKWVRGWIGEHQGLVKVLAIGGLVAAGAAAGLGTLAAAGFTLSGAVSAISLAGGALSTVLAVVSTAMAAILSPAGAVGVAIAGLTAGILYLTGAWWPVVNFLGEGWEKLANFAKESVGAIANALRGGDIRAAAGVLWAGLKLIWQRGVFEVGTIWEAIKAPFAQTFDYLETTAANLWDRIASNATAAFQRVLGALTWVLEAIQKAEYALGGSDQRVVEWQQALDYLNGKIGSADETLNQLDARVAQRNAGYEDRANTPGAYDEARNLRLAELQAQLAAARKEYDDAIAQANAVKPIEVPGFDKAKKDLEFAWDTLDQSKTRVQGAWANSRMSLALGGTSTHEDRQEKLQKSIKDGVWRVVDNTSPQNNAAAYAP